MKLTQALTILGLICAAATPVLAQTSGAIDRGEALRRQREADQILRDLRRDKAEDAPAISQDEAVDVGPQSILRNRQRHRWFEVDLDAQYSWTDNMFFEESNPGKTVGTTVLTSSAQFHITPPEWTVGEGKLQPRVGFQQVWMTYALTGAKTDPISGFKKSDNDFDSQTTFGDLSWTRGNWQVQAGYDWQRLLGHQPTYTAYDEFYRDHSPRWSLSRVFALADKHTLIAAYLGSHHFTRVDATPGLTDEDRNDRTEHNLLLNYSYQLTERIFLQPGYRFQFTHYAHGHRLDQLQSISGSVTLLLTPWLFVRGYAGYDLRESDDTSIPDYRKLDTGMAIGATLKF